MSSSPANMKSLHAFSSLTHLGPQVSHLDPKSETTEPNRTVGLRSPRQPRLSYPSTFAHDHPKKLKSEENPPRGEEVPVTEEEEKKTWNLRPRKASEVKPPSRSNRPQRGIAAESPGGVEAGNEDHRRRLWVALSRDEIEEDMFKMSGNKPSRRPRKRAKTLQKHLDVMFPGLGLVGMNADSFRGSTSPAKCDQVYRPTGKGAFLVKKEG
ncbi:uncharacterized protein LOC108837801 [Raphanus sativus]|uniref:Uncharacterized protein LOC108837801 n=1 Tax=Raphanus sativus TaxID=3726 RepID=A0A6J0M1I2_RAPSA|nr:uncharacterized protein LOC108837801 [Raphanus sativus]